MITSNYLHIVPSYCSTGVRKGHLGNVLMEMSVMKHYVKQNSSGQRVTLMGNTKCCINRLEFGVGVCFFGCFTYKGQQSTS